MKWVFIILAGIFENIWVIELKCSQGFTKLIPSIITILGLIGSLYFLSLAIRTLSLGTAYAIWTGIGIIGTTITTIILFKEPINLFQVISILFIIIGVTGLKLVGNC